MKISKNSPGPFLWIEVLSKDASFICQSEKECVGLVEADTVKESVCASFSAGGSGNT
jgi:hypothetical protein